ncbi:MAG: DUF6065 family protein [Methylorubrum extorquens]|uniref:Uncharacterized protein n=1 Tax=Methylorubrum extorquens (strain DSM 6343 / CIP 106787 / DM4) TaxID=661410 RepID=C7CMP0_METED|nr:DUF6065 family protein [Methylorubrum extorquens]CAX27035.1 protein of unknown function [Methylorubrum extorquens DM4]
MARHGAVRPRIRSFEDDLELKAACEEWRSRRSAFQVRVAAGEPDAIRAGWQRDDIAGRDPAVREGPTFHRTKRILAQARPVGAGRSRCRSMKHRSFHRAGAPENGPSRRRRVRRAHARNMSIERAFSAHFLNNRSPTRQLDARRQQVERHGYACDVEA